jgi:hypothetical protein
VKNKKEWARIVIFIYDRNIERRKREETRKTRRKRKKKLRKD